MRTRYYGVYARNGLGIYDNYGKLLGDQEFMRGEHLKSFQTKEEAKEFALDGFVSLHVSTANLYDVPELKTNWFYFSKALKNDREVILG